MHSHPTDLLRPFPSLFYQKEIESSSSEREKISSSSYLSNLAFSEKRIRSLRYAATTIKHNGCINTVHWSTTGELLYSGSDDRLIKIWRIKTASESTLLHRVESGHRGNIFTVLPKPDDAGTLLSGAADGNVRINYLESRSRGTTLLSSEDFIHKIIFDRENPNVLYTAEECGHITRIDLRSGKKDVIFKHHKTCYDLCAGEYRSNIGHFYPSWSSLAAVKVVTQASCFSTPHLLVGGQGYFVGMIDLRLTNGINEFDESSSSSSFVRLWSPCLPYDNDVEYDSDTLNYYSRVAPFHPYGHQGMDENWSNNASAQSCSAHQLSLSGLDISKNGKYMVANFQADQIYTFNLQSPNDLIGIHGAIGGHINYATFLKGVSYFGPKDEYITAGSDSGHMWIWRSQPARGTGDCKLVNVFKADGRTCNGIAPHPYAPLLVSYGIDSDAKVWHFETPNDDQPMTLPLSVSSCSSSSAEGSVEEKGCLLDSLLPQLSLCRHEGRRDQCKYDRLSLPLNGYESIACEFSDIHNLPHILRVNKNLARPVSFDRLTSLITGPYPRAIGPYQFSLASNHLLEHLLHEHFYPYERKAMEHIEGVIEDVGSYLADDMFFDIMDAECLKYERLQQYVSATLGESPLLMMTDLTKNMIVQTYKSCESIFRARSDVKMKLKLDYLGFIRHSQIKWTPSMLANYFLLPLTELYRVAEIARANGNALFRAKQWARAHYFYCKSFRYVEYILHLARDFDLTGKQRDPSYVDVHTICEQELQRMNSSASEDGQESDDETVDHEQEDEEAESVEEEVEEEDEDEDGNEALIPDISTIVAELQSSNSTSESTSTSRSRLDDLYGPQFDFATMSRKQEEVMQVSSQERKDGSEGLQRDAERLYIAATHEMAKEIMIRLCEKLAPDMGKLALSNLMATFLAMGKYTDTLHVSDDATIFMKKFNLEVDAKLLFRRGCAELQLSLYAEAIEDLSSALTLCPQDASISNKLKQAKRLHELKRKREMQVYTRMFGAEET